MRDRAIVPAIVNEILGGRSPLQPCFVRLAKAVPNADLPIRAGGHEAVIRSELKHGNSIFGSCVSAESRESDNESSLGRIWLAPRGYDTCQ